MAIDSQKQERPESSAKAFGTGAAVCGALNEFWLDSILCVCKKPQELRSPPTGHTGEGKIRMGQGKRLLPPYRIFSEFLVDDLVTELQEHAATHKEAFQPATTLAGYDPAVRVSQKLYFNAAIKQKLQDKILPLTVDFIEALGVSSFEPDGVELELVAHGDGAFYSRHIDTFTGEADASSERQRLISAVLYLHRSPKAFSGGALRLYGLGRGDTIADFVDIEPQHNSLVVFPSWVPHSVERVLCPSDDFMDSRFAINAWLWRKKPRVSQPASSH